jgi:methylenetetrahydrofolate dehydrogenase (NADP+)/methenyltetrahydrofolate cyclohydrolase
MTIIDGRKIRDTLLADVGQGIAMLPFVPLFCDVVVGDDAVSMQYVRMKEKTAEALGIHCQIETFSASITTEALVAEVRKLGALPHMSGLIVQLPLPSHIDKQAVLDAIDPSIDVDCLGTKNSEAFYADGTPFGYPTALACMAILDSLNLDLAGKKIAVLGQGQLVGKPVTHLLKKRTLAVEVISRGTERKEELLKEADIVISAIGEPNFVKGGMLKPGVIVIDAGTSETTGAVVGDVDRSSVEGIASYLSPVPGGVGPVTVAMLFNNVLIAARKKNNE